MKLRAIITLASSGVELQFRAMERSLRGTGCKLPLLVIPYDDNLIELPKCAEWLVDRDFFAWIDNKCSHRMMRKYYTLTQSEYQYVDADVVFLRNPEDVLRDHEGFVVACTEWNKPQWTVTRQTKQSYAGRWSTWQKEIFCAGQYACDRALYDPNELIAFAERPENRGACMDFKLHDQPGTNLLVLSSNVPRCNLTLPPYNMESTWAGDYINSFEHLWRNGATKPYLIHWAGQTLGTDRPINRIFYDLLTDTERLQWEEIQRTRNERARLEAYWPLWIRVVGRILRLADKRFTVQWSDSYLYHL